MIQEARDRILISTRDAVLRLTPSDWRHCSEVCKGLLARAPMNDSAAWPAEHWILGSLAYELSAMAREAGELPAEAMSFGRDPVGRAVELVETLAASQIEQERQRERDAAMSVARLERLDAIWAKERAEREARADDAESHTQ